MSKGTPRRSVRIPDETWNAALELANENGDKLSDIMREALEQYIKEGDRMSEQRVAEGIGEILRAHQPTTGMQVASGVTCRCGYWNGSERAGVDRPVGYQGLTWHQAKELEAAGYATEGGADESLIRSSSPSG